MKYYKFYHYSTKENLEFIDPFYYGTAVTRRSECKYGKTGVNKTYFYTQDTPETTVSSASYRYEIYLPYAWKKQIYDRFDDPHGLYEAVKAKILKEQNRYPYDYELKNDVEQRIKDLGYKGWWYGSSSNAGSLESYVVMLFYKLPVAKPKDASIILTWSEEILENNLIAGSLFFNEAQNNALYEESANPYFPS